MQGAILFVAAAGPSIGGGHVMRCLTLAAELSPRFDCVFLASPAAGRLLDTFAGAAVRRIETAASETPGLVAAARAAAQACDAAAVVFDHYGLCAADHRAVAGPRPAVVIDELADRALGADLLVDLSLGRSAQAYLGRLDADAQMLLGPRYALVRPAFRAARARSLDRRRGGAPTGRALVSMGLTDVGGITAEMARLALPLAPGVGFDVVVGEESASHAALACEPRIRLHPDPPDMAALMEAADFAIGAGGGTNWERCALGLPSLVVVLAENQRPSAEAMALAGAALVAEAGAQRFAETASDAIAALAGDAALRGRLSEASAAICDGLGAARVAQACEALLSRR